MVGKNVVLSTKNLHSLLWIFFQLKTEVNIGPESKPKGKSYWQRLFLCFLADTSLEVAALIQNQTKLSLTPSHLKDSIFFSSFHDLSDSPSFYTLWRERNFIIMEKPWNGYLIAKTRWICDQDCQETQRSTFFPKQL